MKFSNRTLVTLGLILILGNLAFFSYLRRSRAAKEKTLGTVVAAAKSLSRPALARDAIRPRKIADAPAPAACRELWSGIAKEDTGAFSRRSGRSLLAPAVLTKPAAFTETVRRFVASPSPCRGLPKEHSLSRWNELFLAACGPVAELRDLDFSDDKNAQSLVRCHIAFSQYRDRIADAEAPELPLDQITDVERLARRFASVAQDPSQATWAGLADLAQRIAELSPGDPSLTRRALQTRFLDWSESDVPDPAKRAQIEALLTEADRISPGDSVAAEVRLNLARLDGDSALLVKLAKEAQESNAASPVGPYYLAWAAYLADDPAGTKRYLQEALGKDPADGRAAFALSQLEAQANPQAGTIFVAHSPRWAAE